MDRYLGTDIASPGILESIIEQKIEDGVEILQIESLGTDIFSEELGSVVVIEEPLDIGINVKIIRDPLAPDAPGFGTESIMFGDESWTFAD